MAEYKDIGVERLRLRRHDRDPAPAAQLLRHRVDQFDRRRARRPRQGRRLPRRRARRAGKVLLRRRELRRRYDARQVRPAAGRGVVAGAAPLHAGDPPVPLEEADHRRDPWRGGRRRARRRDGAGLPRRLSGDALRGELHTARLPSGLRPDRDVAGGDRQAGGGDDVLYQPPRQRRGGACDGPCRHAGAAGPGARCRAEACRRDRRERAARRPRDARSRCATILRIA